MQAVSQALERKPDCILCMDDRLTLLAMNMLKQQGVRVPQDIRVASLYDSSALAESSPAITAVQFDAYALGRKATQQLCRRSKAVRWRPAWSWATRSVCGNRRKPEIGYIISILGSTPWKRCAAFVGAAYAAAVPGEWAVMGNARAT